MSIQKHLRWLQKLRDRKTFLPADHLDASNLSTFLRSLLPRRSALKLMGDNPKCKEWYFECDGHYIDVAKDTLGRYSVFFRDRADKSEGWYDQADEPLTPETMRKLFEDRYAATVSETTFAWRDADDRYKSAQLQHAWEIWQQAYLSMSKRIEQHQSVKEKEDANQ